MCDAKIHIVTAKVNSMATELAHGLHDPEKSYGTVNPPIYKTSTVVFKDMTSLHDRLAAAEDSSKRAMWYGRMGTPTVFSFEDAITKLTNAYRTSLTSSGLSACVAGLMAFLETGDHVLITDSVYWPIRDYVLKVLPEYGIEATFYNSCAGSDIEKLIRRNTKVIYLESPGSQTFEVQDVPLIADIAHRNGIIVVMDNTWATPLYCDALKLGVDVAIQSCTKYITGHSDVIMGAVSTNEVNWERVKNYITLHGLRTTPEDAYAGIRGLRTLATRLERHQKNALIVSQWLARHPLVEQVLYPALPGTPGHELWKRDYSGASGLMGVVIKFGQVSQMERFVNSLHLFHLGFSWGGFESMIMPETPHPNRAVDSWKYKGILIRIHVGLESPEDLIADLEQAMKHAVGEVGVKMA